MVFSQFVSSSLVLCFTCWNVSICANITTSVYMGKWYKYDVKSRKALILLMERSKKPTIVTAGKILDLSLETFTNILKRSYSLLAVLKTKKLII
ncbi:odorant receptor 85b [Tribolium castaneum]|uniref:odorant receptor 85b n=1 Tax=Tribolium castaneum TaxID=7070 RepID=UPI0030FEC070